MKRIFMGLLFVGIASAALPCNIPVFRYALERWQPDLCELIVFHDGQLSAEDETFVSELESAAFDNQALANARIIRSNVDAKPDDNHQDVLKMLREEQAIKLPYLVVRTKLGRGQTVNHWRGSLQKARSANLLQSPARKDLIQRLLRGDSIVWLLLQSPTKNAPRRHGHFWRRASRHCKPRYRFPRGLDCPAVNCIPKFRCWSNSACWKLTLPTSRRNSSCNC